MIFPLSRRLVLSGLGAAALARDANADGPATSESETARGFVLEIDPGVSASRQRGRGIAGVMVSNGRDVVLTQADGSWKLPVRRGDCLFLVKPAHFAVPGQAGCFSGFYYRCTDEAPLPAAIDFFLMRVQEPLDFRALLVTDTQPDSHEELSFVRDDIIAGLLDQEAAFGIHHGDVVCDALHLYPRYRELLSATGIPWHHCAGNHDIDRAASDDASSRETWKATFGPRHYAFQHAQATFFVLDNVDYLGRASGDYRGRLGQEQLAFVRNVLAHVPQDSLIVLSMHIPLRCHLAPDNPADTTEGFAELLELLRHHPHSVSFSGHLHATEHHYLAPGSADIAPHHHHVLTAASGSWWSGPRDQRGIPSADSTDGTPNGFHILHVDGNRYRTEFVPAHGERPAKFRAAVAAGDEAQDRHRGRLVVNVFDGGPRTRVSCRFAGHDWVDLDKRVMLDPMICRLFAGDLPRKAWVEPTLSSHIWTTPIAPSIASGTHRVAVRIVDEYGHVNLAAALIEVPMDAA